ncbi:hypothetical protein AB0K09_25540 [Streptomyces sp. NPDC049577]|uniref:WXG100-like domain-containing protein n=1 Tax=Streptomyces sp. NPDC049577 TaxID=3155153 RepID=UPI0034194CE7
MAFADIAHPTAFLTAPREPEEFADPLKTINEVADFLTPASWLVKLAELVLGTDPVKWAQTKFAGDWKAYARCAEAWRNLGRACDAMARNLDAGNRHADRTWDGNAADAAFAYFDTLRRDLEEFRDSLDVMSDEYRAVARAVSATGEAMGECLLAILDALITVAITTAAGTATGWTGCGAVMGYALGAQEARFILQQWERMTELLNTAQLAVNACYGTIGRVGGEAMAKLNRFQLPRAGYDHPAV